MSGAAEPQRTARRRWTPFLLALTPALVPVVVFAKGLANRMLIAPGDAFVYALPIHIITARAEKALEVPGWNPFSFSGLPLLATNQPGAFYPPNLLFLFVNAFEANNVLIVFNLAVAGVGAFMLGRKLIGDDLGAAVAGIGFVSCGFLYGHIAHQEVEACAAWIPWLLYAYLRLRERWSLGRLFFAAVVLAFSLLGGHSQMFFLAIAALAVYATLLAALEHDGLRRQLKILTAVVVVVAVVEMAFPPTPGDEVWFFGVDFLVATPWVALGIQRILHAVRRRRHLSRPGFGRRAYALWLVPAIVVAGCALAAVQILPIADILPDTTRSSVSFSQATTYSFSPSQLPLLLFPYLFGNTARIAPFTSAYRGHWNLIEYAGYPGLACLVLALVGIPRIRRDSRAVALALTGGFLLLVSLGASTGVGVLVYLLPVYGQFRAWARYVLLLDLAVAVLAGYGVAHLRRAELAERLRAVRVAWIAVAGLVVLGVTIPLLPPVARDRAPGSAQVLSVAIPLAAAILAGLACVLLARNIRLAGAFCCVLVALDGLLSFGAFFEWRTSPSPAQAHTDYASAVASSWGTMPATAGGIGRYLFDSRTVTPAYPFLPQLTDLEGIDSANGYDPLAPAAYVQAMGNMDYSGTIGDPALFLAHDPATLDLLRVTLVLVPRDKAPRRTPRWLVRLPSPGPIVRYRYTPRVADAFLVGEAQAVPLPKTLKVLSGSSGFELDRLAYVNQACTACTRLRTPGISGRVTDEKRSENSISLDLDALRPSILVVSEDWFPGWSATIDGQASPLVRTDGLVLGVVVPSGRHRVVLSYLPPGFEPGAIISLTALVLLSAGTAGGLAMTRRRARKRAGST